MVFSLIPQLDYKWKWFSVHHIRLQAHLLVRDVARLLGPDDVVIEAIRSIKILAFKPKLFASPLATSATS